MAPVSRSYRKFTIDPSMSFSMALLMTSSGTINHSRGRQDFPKRSMISISNLASAKKPVQQIFKLDGVHVYDLEGFD